LSAALVAFVSRRTNAVQVFRSAGIILANKISCLLQATPQHRPTSCHALPPMATDDAMQYDRVNQMVVDALPWCAQ
jgi:hypothetical protein